MQKEMQEIPISSLRRNGADRGKPSSSGSGGSSLGRVGISVRSTPHVMELTSIVTDSGGGH